MWVQCWKRRSAPRKLPLVPVEEQFQSTWLIGMVERVTTVRVVLNANYWLNYSWITVMSSVMGIKIISHEIPICI